MSGTALPQTQYAYPTAVSWGYPHLEVFAVSDAKIVYWKYRNSDADTWNPSNHSLQLIGGRLGKPKTSVATVARGQEAIHLFISASDGGPVFHKNHTKVRSWNGGPDQWQSVGGMLSTLPTLLSRSENRLDVFALGLDRGVMQAFWAPGDQWSDWTTLGGSWSQYAVTTTFWPEGRMDLFTVHPDSKELFHRYWDGTGWQPEGSFETLRGYCTSRPVAVSWGTGRIDVFVRGGDGGLWHLFYDASTNGWSTWTSISGNKTIKAEPEAVTWGAGRIDVFAWSAEDGSLLHKSYDGKTDTWIPRDGFDTLGGDLGGPPKAVSDAVGSLHVFSYSRYGSLLHAAWNETTKNWLPSSGFEDLGTAGA